jgi:hypothetical protein
LIHEFVIKNKITEILDTNKNETWGRMDTA